MQKKIIGVMGPGESASASDLDIAYRMGVQIAKHHHVLLTGGRNSGVMNAASKGAYENEGEVIGILPGSDKSNMSKFVSIPIISGMGQARNNINVLSSDIIIVIGLGPGTLSELALAMKHQKQIHLFNQPDSIHQLISDLKYDRAKFPDSPESTLLDFLEN